jgi:DNA uptake protein ComE-like DNA-binding protein
LQCGDRRAHDRASADFAGLRFSTHMREPDPAGRTMLCHNRHPSGITPMRSSNLIASLAALMMAASPVLAQTAQPTTPARPATPAPAAPAAAQPATPATPARPAAPAAAQPATPSTPARPATPAAPAAAQPATPARPAAAPAAAPAPAQGQRVNLNTAAQADLDKLPQIGEARAKAILAERAKGRFTNWDNFVQRMQGSAVNQTAKDAIKDKVSF